MKAVKDSIRDELLVLRCRRKDKAALEELIRAWESPLFYYVRQLVDSEADAWDVLQQTWLRAIQGISSLKEPRSLPVWLYTIARRTALRRLRDQYQDRNSAAEQNELANAAAPEDDASFQNAQQVSYGLGLISRPHREILTLFFLDDLSVDEIAAVLELPAGTVKSRLHYAKRALRKVLDEEGMKHG